MSLGLDFGGAMPPKNWNWGGGGEGGSCPSLPPPPPRSAAYDKPRVDIKMYGTYMDFRWS